MVQYPFPVGSITADEIMAMPNGQHLYVVWRRQGRIQKLTLSNQKYRDEYQYSSPAKTWCSPENERRAFTNYFHALGYSLKIKEKRKKENDKQESH